MDWANEKYVRVYVRDSWDIMAVGWEGRAVFWEIIRKVDSTGVLDVSDPEIIADLIRIPPEVTEKGLNKLLERGVLESVNGCLIIPNFMEAQEAKSSGRERQAKSRANRTALARLNGLRAATKIHGVDEGIELSKDSE